MSHFFEQAPGYLPILMQGVYLTVLVTIGAFVLATVLGLVWASMRVSGIAPLAFTASTIIIIVRGIPGMVILFYIYFVMPDLGLSLTAVQAAIIGLGIAYSPYMVEVFRSGIEAIDRGQTEAALSLQGKLLASSTFENTIIFTLVAFIYLAMSLPLTAFNSWLERRLGKSR